MYWCVSGKSITFSRKFINSNMKLFWQVHYSSWPSHLRNTKFADSHVLFIAETSSFWPTVRGECGKRRVCLMHDVPGSMHRVPHETLNTSSLQHLAWHQVCTTQVYNDINPICGRKGGKDFLWITKQHNSYT